MTKMEIVKAKALKVKNHVVRQRYAYMWAALAISASALVVRNNRGFTEFMTEKGINPAEFYLTPEDFEELKS